MLETLFGSRLRARLVGWIFTHPDERFFVRQLALLVHEDSANTARELSRLAALGLVTRRVEGRQTYVAANPSSPVFAELRGLAVKTSGVADVLRDALRPLAAKTRLAFVFGSVARGGESASSDVDVMLVGDASLAEAVAALSPAHDRIGREINPSVYAPLDFRKRARSGQPFLASVMKEPRIYLIGDDRDLQELVGGRLARAPRSDPPGNRRPVRRRRPGQ